MSHIAFFSIPAHGHTNPTLGVVRELVDRGHRVSYYSYEPFREKIVAAGARFLPCDAYDCQLKLSPADGARVGKDLAFSTHILVETALALDEMVGLHMQNDRPDVIVADSMAVWGKAAALKYGIPFVSSTTTFAFNKDSAKIMKQGLGDLFRLLVALPKIDRDLRRLQDKGYPIHNILDILQNDNETHTIVYTSPEFQPCAATFSDKYAFVGPSIRPAVAKVEKTREKLLYLSMGTVNNDMLGLYRRCTEAFGGREMQVIMAVGEQVDMAAFGELPENMQVYRQVDQIAVLEKADAFITHCGMNSVSEALYFGVPLVMLPQTKEQQGVAERVRQVGAGILLDKEDPSALSRAVKEVLTTPSYRQNADLIRDSFRRCPGAQGAAEKILDICCAK